MLKSTKIMLITAGILIGIGMIIGGVTLMARRAKYGDTGYSDAGQSGGHEQKTATITDDFKDIYISDVSSDITIAHTDKSNAYVEYTDGTDYEHRVEVRGDTLRVEYKDTQAWYHKVGIYSSFIFGNGLDGRDYPVNIYLPYGEYGDVKVEVVSGDVSISDLTCEEIEADTTSGDVSIEMCGISRKTDVSTVSGGIRISDSGAGDAYLDTTSGDIAIESVDATETRIDTVSGNVSMSAYSAVMTDIETTSGDVKLDSYKCEKTDIDTTSGSILGSLIGDYNIKFDTYSGESDIESSVSGGSPMNISTTSGDVRLWKK